MYESDPEYCDPIKATSNLYTTNVYIHFVEESQSGNEKIAHFTNIN